MSQGIDTPGTTGYGGTPTPPTPPMGGAAPAEASDVGVAGRPVTEQAKEQAANLAGTASEQAAGVAGAAKDQTRDVATAAVGAAGDVVETAAEKVAEVKQEATVQAKNLVTEATTQVRSQAETQTVRLAEGIAGIGDQLRALADGRPEEAESVRQYLQQGADKLGTVADRLQSQGLEGAIDDLQRFARRRPGVFLLGALGLGLGVGRVVRGAQAASQQQAPEAPAPTEVRGSLAVPGTDGYEATGIDQTTVLPVSAPIPPEVAVMNPVLAQEAPLHADPTLPGTPQ